MSLMWALWKTTARAWHPFHDFDSKVPAELKSELDALKADIISGKIKIESKSQPSA